MKKFFILSLLIAVNSQFAFSLPGVDAGAVNSSAVMDLRLHDAVTRAREKSNVTNKNKAAEQKEIDNIKQEALTNIKHITFLNNNTIASRELLNIIQRYINQPMSVENVSLIRKEIMNYYHKKGYYSAVAMVSAENSQTGELVLDINEGGKNSIIIQDDPSENSR